MLNGVPAAFVLDPAFFPAIFAQDTVVRLRRHLEISDSPPHPHFDSAEAREDLAKAQILFTGWGCPLIDAAVLEQAPSLQAVIHAAGTVKHHVAPEVFERGIVVSTAAAVNAGPVADYTLAVAVLAAKRVIPGTPGQDFQAPERSDPTGLGLLGATVGVVGASHIGRLVIERLHDHGARVLLADPHVSKEVAHRLGATLVDLDTLCRSSAIVTIHAPELPSTRHMFGAPRLALLPDGAVLINTARGSLIDTRALAAECTTGRLNAVLDVTEPAPLPAGHPLLCLPNVLITPHVAGSLGRELRRLGDFAAAEADRLLTGQPLLGAVHLDALARSA